MREDRAGVKAILFIMAGGRAIITYLDWGGGDKTKQHKKKLSTVHVTGTVEPCYKEVRYNKTLFNKVILLVQALYISVFSP